ncbi:MAG: hypothetical protein RLZZ553_1290 [Verrucomicrobiota bacterium]
MRSTFCLCACISVASMTAVRSQETLADLLEAPGTDLSRDVDRANVVQRYAEIQRIRKEKAEAKAKAAGLPVRWLGPDGRINEIESFDGPQPIYFSTQNANAAISTGANLLRVSPYSLSGSGITIGMWDGGSGRATHQEFGARMVVKDGSASIDHATHVGGTMIATGVVASARGMANAAVVDSYDWNSDLTEMTGRGATAAGQEATRIYLSNHSYGYLSGWNYVGNAGSPARLWEWYGTGTTATSIEDDFGRYNSYSRDVDSLSFNAPYYLIFQSAGNERTDNPTNGQNVALSPGSTTVVAYDSTIHPRGDGSYRSGFESIGFRAVAKNVITVGATTDAVSSGLRAPANANMTNFSSWGPTDDGRIKPDVVANGDGLYSSLNGSDTSYGTYSGTSMSTPNACGSASLLVQQYGQLFSGQAMRASSLKGLLIHTADDRGNAGPDYTFGWGLVNVKAAADLLIDHANNPNRIRLSENQISTTITSRTHAFLWDGSSPIRATLSWTDPAGTATTTSDLRTARLVNNLQLKLIAPNGSEFFPYVMPFVGTWTEASMSLPATTGINNTDNVEQILVSSPALTGTWTAVVSYSGTLTNNQQNYSLLISGSSSEPPPPPPLALASITPTSGLGNSIVTIDVSGASLRADTSVRLTKTGEDDIVASSAQLIGETLRCQFNLTNAAAGLWNVTATNPDASSSTLTDAFTVIGSIWSENFDNTVTGWSNESSLGSNNWSISNTQSHSANNCYFASGPASKTTTRLLSPAVFIPLTANNLQFKFWHNYSLQTSRDGGKLEFSVDNGAWFDAGSANSGTAFSSNGYNSVISSGGSPANRSEFAGQSAWSGTSNGYLETIVNLTDTAKFAGKSLRARWIIATDGSTASTGWRVDSISVTGGGDLSNQPPTIVTAANSSSTQSQTDADSSVWKLENGSSTTLSVTASDNNGEANLSYTWTSNGPAAITFTPNATNSAKSCTAEFQTAGDYVATVTIRDAQGLSTTSSVNLRVTQTISRLEVTPAVASLNVGATQTFQATQLDQFGHQISSPPPSLQWTTSGGGNVNSSGVFTATSAGGPFSITATSGLFQDFASVTVNPLPATITLSQLRHTFNQQPQPATAVTNPPNLAVQLTYNGSTSPPVNAGSYQVVAVITDNNYQGSAQDTLIISPASATITLSSLIKTYDQSAQTVTATTTPQGLPVEIRYDGSPTAPTNAGSYEVVATISDANYEGSASGTLVIGKALANATLGNLAATYDGISKAASATTTPEGLTVNLTYNGSATAPSDAGNYEVVATISDANYEGSATGTLVIGKALASVTLGNLVATYDGTSKSAFATTTPEGLTANLTYNGSATAPTDAGNYEVVATISNANYEGSTTGTLVIGKALASVTLGNLATTYDGAAKQASATTIPEGLTVNLTYDGSPIAPSNAGNYQVLATISDANYEGNAQVQMIVAKAPVLISFSALESTFDGTPKSVNTITTPANLNVEVLYNGSTTPPTAAGTYQIHATIIETNYTGEAQTSFVINDPYNQWKEANFTTNQIETGLANPIADPDHDGQSNWVEYQFGFQPQNPDSRLKNELREENGSLILTINRVLTKGIFTIQTSDNLSEIWENMMTLEIEADADHHSISLPKNGAKRFYRIHYQAPPMP